MSEKETKEYTNGEVTILWKAHKCIHSGECTKRLPNVYDPDKRPWIQPEGTSSDAIRKQVAHCPSGALTLKKEEASDKVEPIITTRVDVMVGGPLVVAGDFKLKKADGTITEETKATALCRCGASSSKPYCDGSHADIDWNS
ncbi:MAG: (4Fe-4S)-binding protein [Nonlabens sp.]